MTVLETFAVSAMAGGLLVVDLNKPADEIDALMKCDNALAVFAYNRVVASVGLQHYQTQSAEFAKLPRKVQNVHISGAAFLHHVTVGPIGNEDNGPRLDKFMKHDVLPSLGPAEAVL